MSLEEELLAQELSTKKIVKKMRKERPFDDEPVKKKRVPKEPKAKKIPVCKCCNMDMPFWKKGDPCFNCGKDPMKKPKAEKVEKVKKSEREIVEQYALQTMRKYQTRGHGGGTIEAKEGGAVNKDLWLDRDFYFSVVFQSKKQKYAVMAALEELVRTHTEHKEFELDEPEGSQVQIVNGVRLAQLLGIEIQLETSREYPYGDLDLKPYVLDEEAFT